MRIVCIVVVAALALAGCAGPSVLSKELTSEGQPPLLQANDSRIAIALDAVVIRNGPGAWAEDAAWDEYRFRIRSPSGDPLQVTRITLFDALDQAVEASTNRGDLIDATEEIEKRYEASARVARSASSGNWTAVTATAVATVGTGTIVAAATTYVPGTFMAGAAATGAGVAVGLGLGAGVLVGAGIVKIVNNTQVSSQLERRSARFPFLVGAADSTIAVFFPIAPLPSAVEIAYRDAGVERRLRVPTSTALSETHAPRVAHLIYRREPAYDVPHRSDEGYVRARLSIDAAGRVRGVEIIDASSRKLIPAAELAFLGYRFTVGADGRTTEETMEFKRGMRR